MMLNRALLMTAAAVAGVLALTACGGGTTTPPSATSTPTSASTPVSTPASTPASQTKPTDEAETMRPDGFGPFKLGMNEESAKATGQVGLLLREADGCKEYQLGTDKSGFLLIDGNGVYKITAPRYVHTPQGIGSGSRKSDVLAAFPSAQEYRSGLQAAPYSFVMEANNVITVEVAGDTGCPTGF